MVRAETLFTMQSDNVVLSERVALITRKGKPRSQLRPGCCVRAIATLPTHRNNRMLINWHLLVEGAGLGVTVEGFEPIPLDSIKGKVDCLDGTIEGKDAKICLGILIASLVKRIEFDARENRCRVELNQIGERGASNQEVPFKEECHLYFP